MLYQEPKKLRETKYEPELSRDRQYGWKRKDETSGFQHFKRACAAICDRPALWMQAKIA
jgi:hypothetical protein